MSEDGPGPGMGPITSIEAPGIKAEGQLLQTLRQDVGNLLGLQPHKFPGCQPVSFARSHLEALKRDDYYVCEKSDGIRYLLYATDDGNGGEAHYLIDRKNDYWWVNNQHLHLPLPPPAKVDEFHGETLLDGELVWDSLPDGRKEPRYLIFDCLVMDRQVLVERSLDKRLAYIQSRLYEPYKRLMREYPEERECQPFHVEMKPFEFSYGIVKMFKEVLPKLKHGNDGLIFTCRTTSYKHGTDPNIVKWKPPEENTIDFRLHLQFPLVEPDEEEKSKGITESFVDYDSLPRMEILVWEGKREYNVFDEPLEVTEEEWEVMKQLDDPLNDRIVECNQTADKKWKIVRFRDDKSNANHRSTVDSVYQSIVDRISEENLMMEANQIRDKWKQREEQRRAER